MKILVVEDSSRLRRSLKQGFRHSGLIADFVEDGEKGLSYALNAQYDVIVLDIMLPKLNGLSVLTRLREAGNETPVLILSAKRQVEEKVEGLLIGADDYLTKPFAFTELCARINVLGRRKRNHNSHTLKLGELTINTTSADVSVKDEILSLTTTEYQILECLALRRGRVVSKDSLMNSVNRIDKNNQSNAIEVHVSRLRKKLISASPSLRELIGTKRGMGYLISNSNEGA